MVFVRKVPGRSGSTKVQVAERRAGRDVVLEHVGTARSEAELAVLMAEARRRLRPGQDALDLPFPEQPGEARSGVITSKRSTLLWRVLSAAYERLGFDVVEDAAFQQLVLARIVEPTSKADSVRVLDELGIPHASLRTMFRSLARSGPDDYRDLIATACFNHAAASGDVSLCLYDVTTLYFEAEKEDDLRKVGYSKERRVDPQVVVGLLVDRRGFPLEIGCFEGNKAETTTIIPIIKAFQDRHGLADMVVVADAGMLSASNLKELDEASLRFIVGSRVTKAPMDLESHFRWHGDAFADGQVIDTITPRMAAAASRRPERRDQEGRTSLGPGRAPELLAGGVGLLRKRAARDSEDPDPAGEQGQGSHRRRENRPDPRFVKTSNGTQHPRRGIASEGPAAGRAEGLRHQHPLLVMPAGEVLASYHELWQVEPSFRMSKTDLRARPMFHHTQEAIEAHLTIVFAALAVAVPPGRDRPEHPQDRAHPPSAAADHRPHRPPRATRRRPTHRQRQGHPSTPQPACSMTHPGGTSQVRPPRPPGRNERTSSHPAWAATCA